MVGEEEEEENSLDREVEILKSQICSDFVWSI